MTHPLLKYLTEIAVENNADLLKNVKQISHMCNTYAPKYSTYSCFPILKKIFSSIFVHKHELSPNDKKEGSRVQLALFESLSKFS